MRLSDFVNKAHAPKNNKMQVGKEGKKPILSTGKKRGGGVTVYILCGLPSDLIS